MRHSWVSKGTYRYGGRQAGLVWVATGLFLVNDLIELEV